MGTCGLVDRAADSRLKGLEFDSWCWSYVEVLGKFAFHTALVDPAVMSTWCTYPKLYKKLQAALVPVLPGNGYSLKNICGYGCLNSKQVFYRWIKYLGVAI